jgi:hypothetical protein
VFSPTSPSVDWKISAAEYPSSKSVSLISIFASVAIFSLFHKTQLNFSVRPLKMVEEISGATALKLAKQKQVQKQSFHHG